MENMNRRHSQRIEIKLPCHVSAPALWIPGAIYTENISRGGMLIAWLGESPSWPLGPGQSISIEVELPATHGFGARCIHCEGVVSRVTSSNDSELPGAAPATRIALCINYMDFRSFHDRMRSIQSLQPAATAWMA